MATLTSGTGYSCLGFDVVERRRQALAGWLGSDAPAIPLGTTAHWQSYQALLSQASAHCAATKTRCPIELTPALNGLGGKRVEVAYPDGTRARFYVGKSMGWLPVHLALKRRDSTGGCAVDIPQGATVRVVSGKQ